MSLSVRLVPTFLLATLAVSIGWYPSILLADAPKPPEGFKELFNGKNLDGWQGNTDMKQRATLSSEKQDELLKQRTKMASNTGPCKRWW